MELANCPYKYNCDSHDYERVVCTFLYPLCSIKREYDRRDLQVEAQDKANRLLRLAGRKEEIDQFEAFKLSRKEKGLDFYLDTPERDGVNI